MKKVKELVKYVRSKNAGPFWLTIDIFCGNEEVYQTIRNSPNLTADKIAELYEVDTDKMKVFYMDLIHVIKYSFPRPKPQGHKYENDMHGGQQYVLLSEVQV